MNVLDRLAALLAEARKSPVGARMMVDAGTSINPADCVLIPRNHAEDLLTATRWGLKVRPLGVNDSEEAVRVRQALARLEAEVEE